MRLRGSTGRLQARGLKPRGLRHGTWRDSGLHASGIHLRASKCNQHHDERVQISATAIDWLSPSKVAARAETNLDGARKRVSGGWSPSGPGAMTRGSSCTDTDRCEAGIRSGAE